MTATRAIRSFAMQTPTFSLHRKDTHIDSLLVQPGLFSFSSHHRITAWITDRITKMLSVTRFQIVVRVWRDYVGTVGRRAPRFALARCTLEKSGSKRRILAKVRERRPPCVGT